MKNTINNRFTVASIVTIAAFLISLGFSGTGIGFSLESLKWPLLAKILLATTLTSILTISIYILWRTTGFVIRRSFATRRPWNAFAKVGVLICIIPLGLAAMSASTLTAVSATLFLMQGDMIRAELRSAQTAVVRRPIESFADRLYLVAQHAEDVSAQATAKSNEESTYGRSCGPTRPGAGVITRLRASQATESQLVSDTAGQLSTAAFGILENLRTVTTQAGVNDLYNEATRLFMDRRRSEISRWSDKMATGFETGSFIFEGQTRFCKDAAMAVELRTLYDSLQEIEGLPDSVPLLREASIGDSLVYTVSKMLRVFSATERTREDWAVVPFALFALLIDVVGVCGSLIMGIKTSSRLSAREIEALLMERWVLNNLIWMFSNREAFAFLPKNGEPKFERAAEQVFSRLNVICEGTPLEDIPMTNITGRYRGLPQHFKLLTGGATVCTVYEIDAALSAKISQRRKQVIDRLGDTDRDHPIWKSVRELAADAAKYKRPASVSDLDQKRAEKMSG